MEVKVGDEIEFFKGGISDIGRARARKPYRGTIVKITDKKIYCDDGFKLHQFPKTNRIRKIEQGL